MKLRKWVQYTLVIINILILMTITNNEVITDLILLLLFIVNSVVLLKWGTFDNEN